MPDPLRIDRVALQDLIDARYDVFAVLLAPNGRLDMVVGVVGDFGPNAQPLTFRAGTHRVEIQADGYDPIMFDVDSEVGL